MATEAIGKGIAASAAVGVVATNQFVLDFTGLPWFSIFIAVMIAGAGGGVHSLKYLELPDVPLRFYLRDIAYGMFAGLISILFAGLLSELGWVTLGRYGTLGLAGVGGYLGKPWLDKLGGKLLNYEVKS
ncbi:hypothetical protein [uncultured Paraglaciecola sp.]|uniref:hypothetical protein n=1 Tax=uncultured Paraglaciecola sp. TaxID=1765024 RepID=UPI002626DBDB|nr:hypothetical protein [uncultured Paraglaciecola sp.]